MMMTTTTTAVRDGPKRVTNASASITVGKLFIASKRRISTLSSQRGPYPEIRPSAIPIRSETPVEPKATVSAIRPPCRTREKRSRPNWSVPRRCSAPGGMKRSRGEILDGSALARRSAKTAAPITATTRNRPNAPNGSRRRRRSDLAPRPRAMTGSEIASDTGDQSSHEKVGDEVEQDEEGGGTQNRARDDGEIACQDRVIDELADSGSRKDDLSEDGGGEHLADADAEERHRWQDGDRQGISVDDLIVGQAEGVGRADMARLQHLQHRRADHACDVTDPADPDGERGQDKVHELVARFARLSRPDGRQPLQPDGEDKQRIDRDDEGRHRDDRDRENTHDP